MKNLNTGDDVIYTGETNSWTYRKDIEQNSQGWVENVILCNNEISYRVNFDNGVIASIDSYDLKSKRCYSQPKNEKLGKNLARTSL